MTETRTNTHHIPHYGFFIVVLVAIFILTFFTFKPFLGMLFLAMILAVVFMPLYRSITTVFHGHVHLAALMTILIVFILIFVPLFFLGFFLFREASDLYSFLLQAENSTRIHDAVLNAVASLRSNFPGLPDISQSIDFESYTQTILAWIVSNISSLFSSVFQLVVYFVLLFLSLFYFLKDGKKLLAYILKLSPLSDEHDEMIVRKITDAINAVMKGRLAMSVVQGVIAGAGFVFFGVPNPVLLGLITAICSLVPMIGTSIVIVPGVLYLVFQGEMGSAIGLLIWGGLIVGLIDNVLGPYVIERGMNIHPLLILIAALGGIEYFGLIGFIAGPVILAMLIVLFDIYIHLTKGPDTKAI